MRSRTQDSPWSGIIIAALLIGISRTAISGLAILAMLIVADSYAIHHFRNDADRRTILNILPWALTRLVLGVIIGGYIDDRHFKMTIGLIILVCILWKRRGTWFWAST